MQRFRSHIAALAAGLCLIPSAFAQAATEKPAAYDVVVYGGTSGGVIAAIQAAAMGKSVVLIEPGKHLGGLTSGGLGATDIGNKGAIGGLSRGFYRRVFQHYADDNAWKFQTREQYQNRRQKSSEEEMWTFEPSAAEKIYEDMIREAKVPVVRQERLDRKSGVTKSGSRITTIAMESGRTFTGKMFIDATYEGDLMAAAGVSYHVGRESNATYQETLNGIQFGQKHHQFKVPVDPYKVPGDPKSGLLPGLHDGDPGKHGDGDHRVQAYNFRLCMTNVPANRIPFPKPKGYDPLRYELLLRYLQGGVWDVLGNNQPMPNGKTDTNNNGGFSSDNIGMNYDYPDGDYATRQRIFDEHVTYHQGMMWFLANDPRVPEKVRKEVSAWGLSNDEFTETGGWPHQLYVREARRMISDYVMTQHNCQGKVVAEDPVGLAAYTMDSHNCQRFVKDGKAINEGDVEVGGFAPYPISYRSIVPKADQCSNLLVPVCLSSSHISYGSIRMEPVFMVLGQSAATAACQAIDASCDIQKIDYAKLRERLLADKQVLAWTGPVRPGSFLVKDLPGVVHDFGEEEFVGEWGMSSALGGFVGAGYYHDGNEGKGTKKASATIRLPKPGRYDVRLAYSPNGNRATNVPVTLVTADGEKTLSINQRKAPPIDKSFLSLGTFNFDGETARITISNDGADGYVVVDAVQFLPADGKGAK